MNYGSIKDITIVYAEADCKLREVTVKALKKYSTRIIEARDGKDVLTFYKERTPDLVVLDINLPDISGLEVVKKIRETDKDIPIIMTIACSHKEELIKSAAIHLEKYIVKPYLKEELLDSILKAIEDNNKKDEIIYFTQDSYYHKRTREVFLNGQLQHLTKKELLLLELLINNSGNVITYKEIEDAVWRDKKMAQASLRSLVKLLRKKVPEKVVKNISGLGYKLTL